ncbi:MAG TPA: hypothetical protein VGO73_03300 [Pyrinomonadaceae bacterium]|nr:hypothetical protein [Pyrinomonadaceae bacterium]
MKFTFTLILFATLLSGSTGSLAAEETADVVQSVETLRLQLLEVESREAELQSRVKQLDEDLKPENIERSLAGIGSTKPEELREFRRRQLSIEREGVRAQLRLLATSRERLQAVIRTVETQAYQQSAEGITPPLNQMLAPPNAAGRVWHAAMLVAVIAVVGIVLLVGIARRAYVFSKYSGRNRIVSAHHNNYAH